jgi:hypothetical protein
MSGFVPSVRECLQRLDRMRDTGQLVASLRQIDAELELEYNVSSELRAACERLASLHQLALHLVANMSGGAGVPPTPPATPARRAPSEPAAKQKPPITQWPRTTEPAAEPPSVAEPAPAPLPPLDLSTVYTGIEAAAVIGLSFSAFSKMHSRGLIAAPLPQRFGKQHVWLRTDVHAAKAKRDANPPRRGRPATHLRVSTR